MKRPAESRAPKPRGAADAPRRRRNDPVTRALPIILLTASHAETDIARGFALGADDFVTKPFHPLEMMARVRRRHSLRRGK
ncbi:MAG: response regulator [Candidatus Binataceae bacterium]